MTGFFFCLASAEGAGLLFCPAAIQPPYKRLQWLLYHLCSYTVHATKQRTGLYRGFSCNFTHSTAHDTRPTKADITPPAPRWSVSQRPDNLHRYQTPPPRRTLYRPAQPPYYNNVYKGQGCAPVMDPCQTVQHIADHASPAGSAPTVCGLLASVLHPAACDLAPVSGQGAPGQFGTLHPAGQSSGRRRGTVGGSRRISFRAFAR